MNSDKTRLLALQTAQNACIRFIYGNIPHIPTIDITSHLTHRRLHLGWLSITSRQHLKLAGLAYSVLAKQHPSYLANHLKLTPIQIQDRRPARRPPQDFEYSNPRTSAWRKSFTISSKKLMNSLAITEFDPCRHSEFKSWCFDLFLLLEIEAWQSESSIEGYVPLAATASLPRPTLPFNVSAFTFTNQHLNTPGHSLHVAFIKTFPQPHL